MENIIFIRSLKISGTHGQSATLTRKVFIIDLEITVSNIENAIKNDDLKQTYDYREAVGIAERVIGGPPLHLIETLASNIIKGVLKSPQVQKIKLTLTKREGGDKFDSGITLTLESHRAYLKSNAL